MSHNERGCDQKSAGCAIAWAGRIEAMKAACAERLRKSRRVVMVMGIQWVAEHCLQVGAVSGVLGVTILLIFSLKNTLFSIKVLIMLKIDVSH